MAEQRVAEAFRRSAILSELDPDAFAPRLMRAGAGEALVDDPGGEPCVGLVVSGLIDVWSAAPDGREVLLSTLRAGDCFGISNLLTGNALETRLRAAGAVEIAYVPKQALRARMAEDAQLALRFASLCDTKIGFLLRRIAMLTAQTARGRLISWLMLHADADGRVVSHLTRTDLAAALSVSRAALYRELDALRAQGAIDMDRDGMNVIDREKLEALL